MTGFDSDPIPGEDWDKADGFTEVAPTLRLTTSSGRAFHQLQLNAVGRLYYAHFEDASSYSGALDWIGLIQASQSVRLRLLGDVSYGEQLSVSAQQGASGGPATGLQIPARTKSISARLEDQLQWAITDRWSANQSFRVSAFHPLEAVPLDSANADMLPPFAQATSFEAEVHLGGSHRWNWHSVGADLGLTYLLNLGYTESIVDTENNETIDIDHPAELSQILQLTGNWSWEFSRDWSLELNAGALWATHSNKFGLFYFQPVGRGAVRFMRRHSFLELSVRYTLRPSLQLGETFRVIEVRTVGRLPLQQQDTARWFISGTLGYDWGQRVDLECFERGNSMHAYLADLSLEWQVNHNWDLALHYQFSGQTELPYEAHCMEEFSEVPAFNRHVVMLGAVFRFPGERQRRRTSTRMRRPLSNDVDWQRYFDATPGRRLEGDGGAQGGGGGGGRPRN